jgi:hypothetical protein
MFFTTPLSKLVGDIRCTRTNVPPSHLEFTRNLSALQGAALRGDTDVTLHNNDKPDHLSLLNLRIPRSTHNRDHWRESSINWSDCFDPTRGMNGPAELLEAQSRFGGDVDDYYEGFQLEWLRVVGNGGQAWAVLCEVEFEDASKLKVVLKISLKGAHNDLAAEEAAHREYLDASHTVQALDLHEIAESKRDKLLERTNGRAQLRFTKGKMFNAKALKLVVFEYVPHGDMYNMLGKVYANNLNFNTRILWEIWECRKLRPEIV